MGQVMIARHVANRQNGDAGIDFLRVTAGASGPEASYLLLPEFSHQVAPNAFGRDLVSPGKDHGNWKAQQNEDDEQRVRPFGNL